MIHKFTSAASLPSKTQILVCGIFQDQDWKSCCKDWTPDQMEIFQQELQRLDFKAKVDEQIQLPRMNGEAQVIFMGLGKVEDSLADNLLNFGAKASRLAKSLKCERAALVLSSPSISKAHLTDIVIGLQLGTYTFNHYKKDDESTIMPQKWTLLGNKLDQSAIDRGVILAQSIARARDLVNEPGNILTPLALAEVAKILAESKKLKIKVLDLKGIQKENMNLFLAVASGSTANPPAFIHLHYKPSKKSTRKVFLVGKGVTFDSGGLSLKPPASMMTMKMDMGGAAAVIGAIGAIADLKADVEVHAIVAATENMPDGNSCRPGDIVKGRNGTSVEILNTDAEGRLTLGDALSYAVDHGATEIIDLATLTGACMVALGPNTAALYSDHDELRKGLLQAAQRGREELWHMPLSKNLNKSIKSPVADLKNIGGAYGGSITAALFLQHFVGSVPWAHLDIAGPAYSEEESGYVGKGGRGYGVRTIVEYICPQT